MGEGRQCIALWDIPPFPTLMHSSFTPPPPPTPSLFTPPPLQRDLLHHLAPLPLFCCPPPRACTHARTHTHVHANVRPRAHRHVKALLQFVDLSRVEQRGTLAHMLSLTRGILLRASRMPVWEEGLSASVGAPSSSGPSMANGLFSFAPSDRGQVLVLNHLPALEMEARGEVDVAGRVTVFAQAFRALHSQVPPPPQAWSFMCYLRLSLLRSAFHLCNVRPSV
jgi:hypothetical protein